MECEFKETIEQLERKPGDNWSNVHILDEDDNTVELHVVPIEDSDGHQSGLNCHCEPYIEYKDPETGRKYDYPIIVHSAFDGRHIVEEANQILGTL